MRCTQCDQGVAVVTWGQHALCSTCAASFMTSLSETAKERAREWQNERIKNTALLGQIRQTGALADALQRISDATMPAIPPMGAHQIHAICEQALKATQA